MEKGVGFGPWLRWSLLRKKEKKERINEIKFINPDSALSKFGMKGEQEKC